MNTAKKLLPQGLLLSFIIKMLIVTPGFADMGIVFALSGMIATQIFLEKRSEYEEVKAFANKQAEVIQVMAIEVSKVKTAMEGVKLKNEFTGVGGINKRVG